MAKLTEDHILLAEFRKSFTKAEKELSISSSGFLLEHFLVIYSYLISEGLDNAIAFARDSKNNLQKDNNNRLTVLYRAPSNLNLPTYNFWICIQTYTTEEYQPISFEYIDFQKDPISGEPLSEVICVSGNILTDRTPGSIKAEILEIV